MVSDLKIIIAPDSFKGSLSAFDVASAVAEGILSTLPGCEIEKIPLADGGEGTVQALVSATHGQFHMCTVKSPLGENIPANWGMLGDNRTAVIEMAAASGLPLVPPEKRNPLETTTFGTGQLILDAIQKGCRKIIVGIGGSATTDFGTGMAQALGVRFFKSDGSEITEFMNGRLMGQVARLDVQNLHPKIAECEFYVACDVTNPLLGPNGAVYTYSPQKGATSEMCSILERNLENIAEISKKFLRDVRGIPGAGAAGGLGGGMVAVLNASLQPGIDLVLDAVNFRERIHGANLIITGEGKLDRQTVFGKTISGVVKEARRQNIPVIALAGSVEIGAEECDALGLTACFSICHKPMPLNQAMQNAIELLVSTAQQIIRVYNLSTTNNSDRWFK